MGDLLGSDWDTVVAMAWTNATGGTFATTVTVTGYLPLTGLPATVLAAIPYNPLTVSASASYTWSSGSSTTVSIWEAIWAGAQEILDFTLAASTRPSPSP